MFDYDVFVLGGGPAGLAAAIAARMAGFSVLAADAASPPIDKACGEGLMPDALRAAARLGVSIASASGQPFRGISFHRGGQMVAAPFPQGIGIGIRRTVLQSLLIERADQLGVRLCWGQHMDALDQVRARWIVGADGIQSRVRRWAGLQQLRRDARRFSYRQHYRIAPWSEYVEVHWANKCQFYVTPVSTNEVCLVLLTRDPRQRLADALPQFPSLARRLAGCSETSSERGALAATRRLTRVTSGNAALIGDASGTVDPISGEGICLAFKQALALADALAHGSLRQYEQAHIEICRRPRLMSEFMLLMDRSNFLQRRAMESFTRAPHLFSNLVASHAGQGISVDFLKTAVALGWHVATQ